MRESGRQDRDIEARDEGPLVRGAWSEGQGLESLETGKERLWEGDASCRLERNVQRLSADGDELSLEVLPDPARRAKSWACSQGKTRRRLSAFAESARGLVVLLIAR